VFIDRINNYIIAKHNGMASVKILWDLFITLCMLLDKFH